MSKTVTFYEDYWQHAKDLTESEREIYFSTFSKTQQKQIKKSYYSGKWQDLFIQNEIDILCDKIKNTFHIDLVDLRIRILKGDLVRIERCVWDRIIEEVEKYEKCYNINVLIGNIKSYLLTPENDFYLLNRV